MNQNEKSGWYVIGISILVLLAFGFFAARKAGKSMQVELRNACINNLRQITGAKHGWAMENRKTNGSEIVPDEIAKYLKEGKIPRCPAGTAYILGRVGELPNCSMPGHLLP